MKNHLPIKYHLNSQPGNGGTGSPFVQVSVAEGIEFIACENDGGRPLLIIPDGGNGSPVLFETGMIVGLGRGASSFSIGCLPGDEYAALGLPETSRPQFLGLTAEAAAVYAPNAPKKAAQRLLPKQFPLANGVESALVPRTAGTFMLTVTNPMDNYAIWLSREAGQAGLSDDAAGARNFKLSPGAAVDWPGPLYMFQQSGGASLALLLEHNRPLR